jgi:hypothetical protein
MMITLDPSAPDGFWVQSFANDDWKHCRDYVRARLGLGVFAPSKDGSDFPNRPRRRQIHQPGESADPFARWREGQDPRGTIADRYLQGRGFAVLPEHAGELIRFHRRLWHKEARQHFPGMLVLYRRITTGEPQCIQRTFFRSDGVKLGRKFTGPSGGAAAMLTPWEDLTYGLFVAEGFESALSSHMGGYRPTWCLGSADGIKDLPVIPGVDSLSICTEHDNGTNAEAVTVCADRWLSAGREVFEIEPQIGKDIADTWKAVQA